MSAITKDYISVADSSIANDYTSVGTYNQSFAAPNSSVFKFSITPAQQKYFSTSIQFATRTDDVHSPNIAQIPVNLNYDNGNNNEYSSPNTTTSTTST